MIVGRRDAFSFPEKLGSVMVVSEKHPPPPAVDLDDLRYPANQRQRTAQDAYGWMWSCGHARALWCPIPSWICA